MDITLSDELGAFQAEVRTFLKDSLSPEIREAARLCATIVPEIGATMAWRIAALNPGRVLTLACLNIPHQGAFFEASAKSDANAKEQREKFSYFKDSRKTGNERDMFHRMLESQGMPEEETEPYRKALDSDAALEAVYNYYRAIPLWQRDRLPKCPMPTLFIWPPGSGNVSRAAAEAKPFFR